MFFLGMSSMMNYVFICIFSLISLYFLLILNDFGLNMFVLSFLEGLNFFYILGLDKISCIFILLSGFLLLICVIFCWYLSYLNTFLMCLLSFSFFILMNIFGVNDLWLFFFFFELLIIPMYLLMGIWGGRISKMYAAYFFLVYTLLGSVFLLFSFFFIFNMTGTLNFEYLNGFFFSPLNQFVICLFIFLGLSVKIPMVPLHLWLPEAHVEAPAVGSIILAGIVLKLGFYLFLRVLFWCMNGWLVNFFFIIFFVGFYFASFSAFAQVDIKKIVAYSSVSHMNFGMLGFFSKELVGILGSFFLMLGHAMVASALFLAMGILYERYKTSILYYYSGLFSLMPFWVLSFFVFMVGNFGLPGTVNFVGEFLIMISIFNIKIFFLFLLFFGLMLTLGYSLFLYVRMSNGMVSLNFMKYFSDLTRREFLLIIVLMFCVVFFGFFPQMWFNYFFFLCYLLWLF